jgi:hypothetical protein
MPSRFERFGRALLDDSVRATGRFVVAIVMSLVAFTLLYWDLSGAPIQVNAIALSLLVITAIFLLLPFSLAIQLPGGARAQFLADKAVTATLNVIQADGAEIAKALSERHGVPHGPPAAPYRAEGSPTTLRGPITRNLRDALIQGHQQLAGQLRALAVAAGVPPTEGSAAPYADAMMLQHTQVLSDAEHDAVVSLLDATEAGIYGELPPYRELQRLAGVRFLMGMLLSNRLEERKRTQKPASGG